MKRTVEGQRQGDGFVLVDRHVSGKAIAAWSSVALAVMSAVVAILKCILEAGVL